MAVKREILIVEDNEINREILGEILAEDYQVWKAGNGQVALDILRERRHTIALILLDVMMPVMDGYTFLNVVKADAELSLIPVIVMTQGNSEQDEIAALEHGATDFLPKPYRPQIILHRIAGLIKFRETAAVINQLQYDRLTGVYTKEFFYRKVQEQLQEDPEGEYCIVSSNIENFKLVNDIFGMREGDRLLQEIANNTRQMVGPDGFCGRFGADRFLCFQKKEKERIDRQSFFSRSHEEMPISLKNIRMRWGIYEIRNRAVPVEQMCDRAMLAADSIKNQYQNFVAVYDDSIRSKLLRDQAITTAMDTALAENQFLVYLQPKYSIQENCLAGAEALVRWIHPTLGFISPGEFIPLFEKNGSIPKLDNYVWEKICCMLSDWREKGYPMLPVSVNVSRADMFQGHLTDSIQGLVRKYDIDPSYLHLEITESAYAENPEQIVSTVNDLREAGFIVEMDDFGSGYSSLNMLSQMSLDILKLDMRFVQNETSKPVDRSFLADVVSMAHRADLRVVAEGVETREQLDRLIEVDCDYVQGYFFAKPMPATEYEKLLEKCQPEGGFDPESQRNMSHPDSLLVVDADEAYVEKVRQTFEGNYQVLGSSNPQEALEYLQFAEKNKITAVILSMTFPNGGSAEVMKALRQTPACWDIPVLATIPSSECGKGMPMLAEADEFLCKRHPVFDLQRRVQKMIEAACARKRERILKAEASHDPLTGLLNRRGFQEAVVAIRESDLPIAVYIFDLDDLKTVNDTFGHDKGDEMLQSFAQLLRSNTRPGDIKCRYGGDEFIAVLKHMNHSDSAVKKGEKICRFFREDMAQAGCESTCSCGVALCQEDFRKLDDWISRADQAMYRAKRENKGFCCAWEEKN